METTRSAYSVLKKLLCPLVAMLLSFLAAGCGTGAVPPADEPEPSYEPSYVVTYYADGKRLRSLSVSEGDRPPDYSAAAKEGMRFLGWTDESGEPVRPENAAVNADTEYYALYLPLLDRHEPYLFTDENGLLRPEDPLGNAELEAALNALVSEEASGQVPALPRSGSVSTQRLYDILLGFFSARELEAAFAQADFESDVTRAGFAAIMGTLLSRDGQETLVAAEDAQSIPDVPDTRDDYAGLMEAAVPHVRSEWGTAWQEQELSSVYPEGFLLMDGSLYCVDGSGYFVCGDTVGGLAFGPDGRQTSGSAVLDGYVRAVLGDICAANPDAETLDLLRLAYEYTRDSFTYLRRNAYSVGDDGWQVTDAVNMFRTERGNCYSYAAVFWALARGLGYEAAAISGTVGLDRDPHGWVEIYFDDVRYTFDPELEMAYRRDGITAHDMFMMEPNRAARWFYYTTRTET